MKPLLRAAVRLTNAVIFGIWIIVVVAAVAATFASGPFVLLQKFLTKQIERRTE